MKVLTTLPPSPDYPSGIEPAKIAYGYQLSRDPMTWQPNHVDAWLEANVPDDYNGYVTLDWETGLAAVLLQHSPTHPDLDDAIAQYVGLLTYVKQARPRCEVGYFSFPRGGHPNNPDPSYEHARRLQPVFDAADVLFPSWYMRANWSFDFWKQQVTAYLPMALEVAKDQPVFPYTSHRYAGLAQPDGFSLVPPDIHMQGIGHLQSIRRDGRRIAGIVTWGDDQKNYDNATELGEDGTSPVHTGPRWDNVRTAFLDELNIEQHVAKTYSDLYKRLTRRVPKE